MRVRRTRPGADPRAARHDLERVRAAAAPSSRRAGRSGTSRGGCPTCSRPRRALRSSRRPRAACSPASRTSRVAVGAVPDGGRARRASHRAVRRDAPRDAAPALPRGRQVGGGLGDRVVRRAQGRDGLDAALRRAARVHHQRLLPSEGARRRDRVSQRRSRTPRSSRWTSATIALEAVPESPEEAFESRRRPPPAPSDLLGFYGEPVRGDPRAAGVARRQAGDARSEEPDRKLTLLPAGEPDRFTVDWFQRESGEPVEFHRDAAGRVTGVTHRPVLAAPLRAARRRHRPLSRAVARPSSQCSNPVAKIHAT